MRMVRAGNLISKFLDQRIKGSLRVETEAALMLGTEWTPSGVFFSLA